MIRQAKPEEKAMIYTLWKSAFAFDDNGSIDHYFARYYQDKQSYVLEENGVLVCSLQTREKVMNLYGNKLLVNYIVGVVTVEEYRRKGYMKQLLDAVLEEASHHYLITVLQAYNPSVYEPFGFETVIENKETLIRSDDLLRKNSVGVTLNAKPSEIMDCYQKFTRYFTGYFERSLEDFEIMIEGIRAEGGQILSYYQDGELKGYGFVFNDGEQTRLDEVCYLDSTALLKLVSAAAHPNKDLILVTSTKEKIRKVFPDAKSAKKPFMMAKINNAQLFEDLYHVKIISGYSAFNAFSLPLFNRDYQ